MIKKLEEQLKLLKNSAELYDKGRVEEALNIAIRLRVLFYDTSSSTSLIKYLKQKETIKLLSTLEDHSKNPMLKNIEIQSSIYFLTSNGQRAFFDKTGRSELIPLKEWLTETIITLANKPYSRIDIIKITVHKDGGAHIEVDHEDLKPFITPLGKLTIQENNKPVTKDVSSHHYILLRQIAYEVLHSEELFKINGLDYKPMDEIKSYNEYLREADNLNEEKKHYKAIKLYEKAIDVNPDNAICAYNNMGKCLSSLGEDEEAVQSYLKSIEQDNSYIDPLWNLSLIHNKDKRYDLTIDLYQKILKIDNKHQGANHNLWATLNILTDLEDEIIKQYRDFQKNKPTNTIYIDYLGTSLLKYNYLQEAETLYKYALQITPNNINYLNNLAYAYCRQEKYIETDTVFNSIIDIGTDRIDVILNILEFKLIEDFTGYEVLLNNLKNRDTLLYQIFHFLFTFKDAKEVDEDIRKLLEKSPMEKINYDYSEIKQWVIQNNMDQRVVALLEKYFNLPMS